jgi:benzoyl-CoA-dihydrodiol lyase
LFPARTGAIEVQNNAAGRRPIIDFQTDPARYRHWRIEPDGDVAYLIMDVDQAGGLSEGYELKLNSYDLGVDIELNDAVQRLRFEHPEVRCVIIKSGKDNVFCAGANIRMLGKATHGHKVNFCKFTNETRFAIEDASENSKQIYICAINGNAAGGGYELALAADHIMLVDDRRSAVALPETPLLAVLPGTGGLTRVTDKRKVRRDRADVFCSIEAPRQSNGGWSTKSCRTRNGKRRSLRARMKSRRAPTGRRTPRGSLLRRSTARSTATACRIRMSKSKSTARAAS